MSAFGAAAAQTARRIVASTFLGEIVPEASSELYFPSGLPGFETEHAMLPIEIPAYRPLVFLQSALRAEVCFVCLPVSSIDPGFQLAISEDDRLALELDPDRELIPGEDILCLALLIPVPGSVKANLDASVVINLRNYRCAQVVGALLNGIRRLSDDGRWERVC